MEHSKQHPSCQCFCFSASVFAFHIVSTSIALDQRVALGVGLLLLPFSLYSRGRLSLVSGWFVLEKGYFPVFFIVSGWESWCLGSFMWSWPRRQRHLACHDRHASPPIVWGVPSSST